MFHVKHIEGMSGQAILWLFLHLTTKGDYKMEKVPHPRQQMSGRMITPPDLERLRALVMDTISKNPDARQGYKDKGLSETRFRWDTYHVTTDAAQHSGRLDDYLFLRRLYDYLNDDNMDAALKAIIH
jgi:hypothetical protein